MKNIFLISFFFFSLWHTAQADSPLTAIKFATVYYDNDFVRVARLTNGQLTKELMSYLVNETIPIDIKMAIINELGWNISGKSNYDKFLKYLVQNKIIKSKSKIKNASADIILSLAYLKAMDDYFNVKKALKFANMAKKKAPKSYTVNLIAALIKAQQTMDDDWCAVYHITDNVRQDKSLIIDMRSKASDIIFLYMDSYKMDCK